MTTALRRSSVAAAVILFLVLAPVEAAGPLALFAKQIVKQMLQDYVQSQLTSLVTGSGSACKPGSGMPAMSIAPAMPAQITQLMPSPSSMPSTPEMQQMDPAMRAQMMQMMAGMQSAPPLSGAEVDELVTRLTALSKAMPDQALPCSPEELKAMLAASASMPMLSGSMRMMLEQFRAMEQSARQAEETFARMSSAEEAEAIETMLAELASLDAEERRQFAAVLESDLTGIPASMRAELRARLAQSR
jgi:hypothetical protein